MALLLSAACGKSGDGPGAPATGSLAVVVAGLPAGQSAAITVTGPGGFSQAVTSATTLASLEPGSYTVAVERVMAGDVAYDAESASQTVSVSAGKTPASITVAYAVRTGILRVTVSGLPDGSSAAIQVTGPSGFSRTVTSTTTLTALAPGEYVVASASTVTSGHTFVPDAATQVKSIVASTSPVAATVSYALTTGAVAVAMGGLPAGASGQSVLTGPNGYQHTVTGSETVTNLAPGTYTLTTSSVTIAGDRYATSGTPLQIAIAASLVPVPAPVAYALVSGRLSVSATGLPSGTTASFTITGPGGFSATAAPGETLSGLVPGTYAVASPVVSSGTNLYAATPGTQQVGVVASPTPAQAAFAYALASGALNVTILGLPQSVSGNVTVTGPAGYNITVAQTQALTGLVPGTYTVSAANATSGSNIYAPTPPTQSVTVAAGAAPSTTTVNYALASGSIALQVSGLPGSGNANVLVTGPGGFSRTMTGSGVLLGLTPGSYTLAAAVVTVSGSSYAPAPASQSVTVVASVVAVSANVVYTAASGSLALSISGLPGGVNAAVSVTGPGGYSQNVTATQTLVGLLSGSYSIIASPVSNAGTTYNPTPLSQNVSVAGAPANASVTYSAAGAGLNLLIDGATLTQTVQTYGGTVQLIANKDALLRVFVKATQANAAAPQVRARFYNGATLLSTLTISAPGASVPTTVDQATIGSSWNTTVPASLLQPGVSMLLDVDPTNTVTESSETDNAFPASGSAQALNIVAVSTFQIRMIPVTQSANGLTGDVTGANKDQFLALLRKLYPVSAVDIDVRAAFTTSAPALDAGDANGAWGQILSEINALRTADASTRYYYGVVKVGYSSGVAGLGYVPGRAAIGWDYLPSGATVLTHEVGHNFGRYHAPCGGPGGVDPTYPYAGGAIGVYGYDLTTASLKLPTQADVMSYCSNVWISDYNYNAIFTYRQANPFIVSAAAARPGLLIWGRIANGRVILEPAFDVVAPPSLPRRTGRHRLELTGDRGETLVALSFDGEKVADSPTNDETFAFVVPSDMLRGRTVARLRVGNAGGAQEIREPSVARRPLVRDSSEVPRVTPVGRGLVRITWAGSEVRGVLVRDAHSGDILAFARGGSVLVRTNARDLDLTLSNGVRSEGHRVQVRR